MPNITWVEHSANEDIEDNVNRLYEFPIGMDGPILYLRRSYPHGLIEFATEKGPVPNDLKGQWTDLEMAKLAGQKYTNENVSPVKFNPKGVPAKIKSESETRRTKAFRENFKARKDS